MKTALTIAGSDSGGGAGIQADLKTMTMHGVYAMTAITALTAQNTVKVSAIMEVTPKFLEQQLDAVFQDIFPDAVKIGMVHSAALIEVIAKKLAFYDARNIVIDPVMAATSKTNLIDEAGINAMKQYLLTLADLVTPNIPEAEILSGISIQSEQDMERAAGKISDAYGCAVLCKGGHTHCNANDVLYTSGQIYWFYGSRINNPNTHGTGCTLSSAIASNLAKGASLPESVRLGKFYVSGALSSMIHLGKGNGPLNHAFLLNSIEKENYYEKL